MNNLGAGQKEHLMKYSGVEVKDGRVGLKMSDWGKIQKACGGRYQHPVNAVRFAEARKNHPESVCKKCEARFNALMAEARKLAA